MNIIFDHKLIDSLKQRHVVLELDSFRIEQKVVKSWCVVDKIKINEIDTIEHYEKLHNELIQSYRRQDWKICVDAIALLKGRWGGELDSFYVEILARIQQLKTADLPSDWMGIVDKSGIDTARS